MLTCVPPPAHGQRYLWPVASPPPRASALLCFCAPASAREPRPPLRPPPSGCGVLRAQQDDPADVKRAAGRPFTDYVSGVVAWAAIGLLLGSVVACAGVACCCFRCVLPACGINTCGKRYPTPRLGFWQSCGLGFRARDPASVAKGFGYRTGSLVARLAALVALALIVVAAQVCVWEVTRSHCASASLGVPRA